MRLRIEIAVFILGLLAILCYSSVLDMHSTINDPAYITIDAVSYVTAAEMLSENFHPHPARALGFAAILSPPILAGADAGGVNWYAFVLNSVLWCLSLVLIYRIATILVSRPWAPLCVLLYVGCVGGISSLNTALSEPVFTFLLVLAFYQLCLKWRDDNSGDGLLRMAAIVLLGATIRPGALYLGLTILLLAVVALAWEKKAPGAGSIGAIVTAVVLILFSMTMMSAKYDVFSLSTISKITWYPYLGAQVEAELEGKDVAEVKKQRHEHIHDMRPDHHAISVLADADLKSKLSEHPEVVFKHMMRNIQTNYKGGAAGIERSIATAGDSMLKSKLFALSEWQNRLLTFLGLLSTAVVLLLKRQLPYLVVLGVITYTVLTSGISFWQGDRFHVAFYPLAIIMIVALTEHMISKVRPRHAIAVQDQ